MKERSMIRRVDGLGRIVIPVELRRMMDMDSGQDIEMIIKDDSLILRRFVPGCIFCGEYKALVVYEGKNVCAGCRRKLAIRE